MKYYMLIIFTFLFISCSGKKEIAQKNNTIESLNICPKEGVCSVKIYLNNSLNVLKDDTGATYHTFSEDSTKTVIVFEYNKTVEEGLADAYYKEDVIFEINNDVTSLSLKDQELTSTKMLFGKHCFCRDQVGYYNITSGNLTLKKTNNEYLFNLTFNVDKVNHLIKNIKN